MDAADATPVIDWGSAGAALDDAPESGDLQVVAEFPGGALVGLIDGLGHGPEAATAARAARDLIVAQPAAPVDELIQRCHEGIRKTRGVVVTLAAFDGRQDTLTWVGVGNVEATLFHADPARPQREALVVRGGVVGCQLPPLRVQTLPVGRGDTLVLVSDGIRPGIGDEAPFDFSPRTVAETILARHASGQDDALVVVARYRGGAR